MSVTVFHNSLPHLRDSIAAQGLLSKNPNHKSFEDRKVGNGLCPADPILGVHETPTGVYVWTKLAVAKKFGFYIDLHQGLQVSYDIWQIDIPSEYEQYLVKDECTACGWQVSDITIKCYVGGDIPPEWISLHSTSIYEDSGIAKARNIYGSFLQSLQKADQWFEKRL